MHVSQTSAAKLNWRSDGPEDAPVVVFANSLGTDLRLWDKVVPALSDRFRLIRFDKRGHGLSSCPDAPYDMQDLVQDAEELLDNLAIKACVFVGLSIGGMIGQGLASKRPDLISALVLSNTAAKMGDAEMWLQRISVIEAGGIQALATPIMERWFSPEFRATDELEIWRNMLTRTPKAGYLGCCHAIAGTDLSETTSALQLPCLAIAGSVDGASPPELVEATAKMIDGSQFEVIDGAGHLPCVEASDKYTEILSQFLKEIRGV